MKPEYSEAAGSDLDEIWLHIAADSEDAADRWITRLRSTAERVASSLSIVIGHRRDDIDDPSVLCFPVGEYLITYGIRNVAVQVVRVVHGSRDLTRLDWHSF